MRINLRQTFVFILFMSLFVMTLRPIADPDFWWHLRTGQLIAETGAIPHTDPYSYTKLGQPWITHEWLSELLIYGIHKVGGIWLLVLIFSLIITAAFLLVYLRFPAGTRPYVAGFTLLLGALATAPTWGVRPQMVSLLLFSLFLLLLDRYQQSRRLKFLLPLPFLTMLWVNLHAGYLLGLAAVGIYLAGDFVGLILELVGNKQPAFKHLFVLGGVLAACLLAAMANPNGYHILLYPFETLTSQSMQQFIQEWFSPDFHQMEWQPLAGMLLALIGAGMLGKKPISATKILLTIFFAYAALRSMRNVPLFVAAAAPVLGEQIGSFLRIQPEVQAPKRIIRWAITFLLVFGILGAGLRFVQVVQEQAKTESSNFPKAAVDWMIKNQPEGNLFNAYGWGGYLIWRLYPEYPVYIDGRADVYGDGFIFAFVSAHNGEQGWQETLHKYDVRLVLVEQDSGLANVLRQSQGWKKVYEDLQSVIFVSQP